MNILNPTSDTTKALIEIVQNYEMGLLANSFETLKALCFVLYDHKVIAGGELDKLIDRIDRLPSIKAAEEIRNQLKNRAQ